LAEDFESLATAVQAAVKYRLYGAEVILQVGDQPNEYYDIRLDLLEHSAQAPRPAGEQPGDTS